MDGSEAEASLRRLGKGQFVDVCFDLGEDKAADAFVRKVAAFGLKGELYQDEPSSWYGSRRSPLFLKLSVAVLVGFAIWVWVSIRRFDTTVVKAVSIVEGLVVVCWLFSGTGGILDRRPESESENEGDRNQRSRWILGLVLALIVVRIIIAEPVFGLVLLMLAAGGIGCAFLIRALNRT